MAEVRVRSLSEDVVEALDAAAKRLGRSLESHIRELLKEAARAGIGQFPLASEWIRAGFDEVHELIPGRQYLAWAALRAFRVTISQSLTGEEPEWNTEIEESARVYVDHQSELISIWSRATDVRQRLLGTSGSAALRDAIRWIAEYTGVEAVGQARAIAEITSRFSTPFKRLVSLLDKFIKGTKRFPRDNMVIWSTKNYDVYVNRIDDIRGALMVYECGHDWSVSDGEATYFSLDSEGYTKVVNKLTELGLTYPDDINDVRSAV